MDTAVFVARVFGIFYLAAAVGMILNRSFYQKFMEDYSNNAVLIFLTGMIALVAGTVIVLLHNVWAANWTVLVTIIGWGGLIKGVWIIIFPETVPRFMEIYRNNTKLLTAHSVVALVFGIVLAYFGFFA